MKKTVLLAGIMLAFAVPAFAADPLVGKWRTSKDDNGNSGIINVAPCGDALCGVLVQSFDSSGKVFKSKNQGRNIISATKPTGGGKYKGKVIFTRSRENV